MLSTADKQQIWNKFKDEHPSVKMTLARYAFSPIIRGNDKEGITGHIKDIYLAYQHAMGSSESSAKLTLPKDLTDFVQETFFTCPGNCGGFL
jgi:hypothetical protein